MFVATFLLYGGLYHTTLLLRFLVGRDAIFWSESYVSSSSYPASPRACRYTVFGAKPQASLTVDTTYTSLTLDINKPMFAYEFVCACIFKFEILFD